MRSGHRTQSQSRVNSPLVAVTTSRQSGPVVVVQGDSLNRSSLATVVCVPLTGNLVWAEAPGNVFLSRKITGLNKDCVANVSQIVTVDRGILAERVGKLPAAKTESILSGIYIEWGRGDA
ncbi:MAG: type II toxin-antitoxin system PemK/MazF family toxin [Chloroflexi bacterium]|nr:type II toxin-antitoxin system PemK/MazF family toxin [Chloroflexota bacterium]